MDLDERNVTAGDAKSDFDDALPKKQQKVKKARNVSDDSDSDDSDYDVDDYMDDFTSNELLGDCTDDELDENEPADILSEWESHPELKRYHKALTQCKLMQTYQHERLILDPGAGFYLIDGDSLIIEAMETKSWRYGQQLHLFYLIEIYLYQLRENGGGAFEIVFFKDMERIWYDDILLRLFREAIINHLSINCGIKVHREWKDPFDPLWEEYLSIENPSFIFIHDGCSQSPTVDVTLKILSYKCLERNIDIAFTSNVKKQASKLHAVFVKSQFGHAHESNKTFIRSAWSCLVKFLNNKYIDVPKIEEPFEVNNFKDDLFIKSLECYWNDLSEEERKSDDVKYTVNRWCRYFSVLSCASLSERIAIARTTEHDFKGKLPANSHLYKFLHCILRCLRDSTSLLSNCEDLESIADVVDLSVYQQLFESTTTTAIISSNKFESKYIVLRDLAKSKGIEFETDVVDFSSIEPTTNGFSVEKESALIAVESHLAEEYAGEVKKDLNVADSAILDEDSDGDNDDFDDIYNWMSGEMLKDDVDHSAQKALSKKPLIRKKQLKDIQKFNDFIAMYGKTMEKTIEPTLITKTENKENKENKKAEKVHQKQKSKKQGNKKNMKETIIEENKKKILEENKKKVATQWKTKKGEIDDTDDVALAIQKALDFIRKSDSSKLSFEDPLILLLQLQYDRWKQSCSEGDIGNISYAADLVQTLHGILQSENASDNLKLKVAKYFLRLGFKDVASNVIKTLPESKKGPLKISDKCPVDLPYNVFQMKFMGHLLKRQERFDPDPRVTGFIPDTWQRELLDVVDKNESAVIVAPTSSGKTFCSFYCMEKVLRESDTNVVVYVSPTKALVNQVQASIYSRYNKNMPAGMSIVGCFTRDYQYNALTSQILVTVPACLEILLLSPKRQQWASKISYVIFDEVHCIGGETGGEVWEHLITLIRCPFLALSATVGNPEFFHSWLRCVNKFKEMQNEQSGKGKSSMKYNVKLVVHNERYSDISKSIYLPRSDQIVETHPCIFLDAHSLSSVGFPSAFSLSPKEAHELWEAGIDSFKDDTDESNILQKWNPESYFGEKSFITKQMAREYEISLKKQLEGMFKDDPSKAQLLLDYLRKGLAGNIVDNTDKGCELDGVSEKEFNIYKTFPTMIEKLKSEDKLPVIVFMNNRHGIEMLAKTLSAHVAKKISDVQSKMSDVYAKEAEADERAKKTGKSKKNVDSDGEEIENHMQEYLQGLKNKQTLIIQKKENACKFISPGTLSSEDREKILSFVKERTMLEFGIGYHHSGCNIKHKRAVEILFRSKFAQVALATATLALGIHMPCKSVVFVGDDHYVDALNYRQMSGRSGRRGFDNLGNVIFYGVPLPKISKLIKADISRLDGQFPVSCTIILRLLLLVMGAADNDDAHKKAMTVLSHPFVAHQAPPLQTQLRHYFLFVTDFLIRQALIDEKGVPLGFSGLVSHLHYHEPGNLVFVSLLRKGIFHAICKPSKVSEPISFGKTCQKCSISPIPGNRYTCTLCPYDYDLCSKCFSTHTFHKVRKNEHRRTDFEENEANLKFTYSEDTLRSLVSILSHVFCVKEVPSIRLKVGPGNSSELKKKPKTSKVILESMSDDVLKAVSAYNDSVQSIFGNYICVVSKTLPKDSHVRLPLSQKSWKLNTEELHENGSSVEHFVQLSGCSNDDVKTYCLDTEEIRRIIPRQIYMNFNFIPALSIGKSLNSYALDFFKHTSRKALVSDNWISISEVYDLLNDFRLLISTISIALEQLGPEDSDDHVVWAFKHLKFEYGHRFQGAFPGARIKQSY